MGATLEGDRPRLAAVCFDTRRARQASAEALFADPTHRVLSTRQLAQTSALLRALAGVYRRKAPALCSRTHLGVQSACCMDCGSHIASYAATTSCALYMACCKSALQSPKRSYWCTNAPECSMAALLRTAVCSGAAQLCRADYITSKRSACRPSQIHVQNLTRSAAASRHSAVQTGVLRQERLHATCCEVQGPSSTHKRHHSNAHTFSEVSSAQLIS